MWNLFTHFFKYGSQSYALLSRDVKMISMTVNYAKKSQTSMRLTSLEKLWAQMNTNISSMQTIVNALQQNDFKPLPPPVIIRK